MIKNKVLDIKKLFLKTVFKTMYQSLTFSHLKIFFVLKMKSLNHDFSFKKLFYDIKFIFTENLLNKIK